MLYRIDDDLSKCYIAVRHVSRTTAQRLRKRSCVFFPVVVDLAEVLREVTIIPRWYLPTFFATALVSSRYRKK
jgi:hypothetical protein